MPLSFRPLTGAELPPFSQYILPYKLKDLRAGAPGLVALGAVSGRCACGAAVAQVADGRAQLTSLFIDENARGQGIGGALLDQLCKQCAEAGAGVLGADYVLSGSDLDAMDALFRRRGASPSAHSMVYRVHSTQVRDKRFLGSCFSPSFRPAEGIVPFSDLTPKQLEAMEDPSLPHYLHWSFLADRADPSTSLALLIDAKVCAYLVVGESCDGGCLLHASVSLPGAPASAFLSLLQAVIHQGYYRFGGDYVFYTSTVNPHSDTLVRKLTGMDCEPFEGHIAELDLSHFGENRAVSLPPYIRFHKLNRRKGAGSMDLVTQQAMFSIIKKKLEDLGLEVDALPCPGEPQIGESLRTVITVTENGDHVLLECMLVELNEGMLLLQFYATLFAELTPDLQALLSEALIELNFSCPVGHFGLYRPNGQLYHKYTALLSGAPDPSAMAEFAMDCLGAVYEMLEYNYPALFALIPDTEL